MLETIPLHVLAGVLAILISCFGSVMFWYELYPDLGYRIHFFSVIQEV
jgi:hypothetical protein